MGLTSNTGPYNAAAEHFGVDDPVMVKTPRSLFQFSLEFVLNESITIQDASFPKTFTFNRVQNVSMPDFDYGIQPINQYNRIRYVPTRMTPGPLTVVFYDTKDNQFQSLMKAYSQHYFQGHDMESKNFTGYSMLNSDFANGDGHDFGAKTITGDTRFFFEEIRVHNKDTAQGGRTTVAYNCMMTQVQHTTFDYTNSGPATYSAVFQPEHVNIGAVDASLINERDAQIQNVQSTTASTVAFRPPTTGLVPQGAQLYTGQDIPRTSGLQNINNQTFVIPNVTS